MKKKTLNKQDEQKLSQLRDGELLVHFPKAKYGYNRDELRTMKLELLAKQVITPESIGKEVKERQLKNQGKQIENKNKLLIEQVEKLEKENEALLALQNTPESYEIQAFPESNGSGEATSILVASDWHVEERVTPESINQMNKYTVEIARKRSMEFFQTGLKLINLEKRNTNIPRLVLALLGDFITGNIHEENLSTCSLLPIDAAIEAQVMLKSGIDFLLKESDLKEIIVQCHAGNHSRITEKRRSSETEMGNSLELFIYSSLAKLYEDNQRIKFNISRSYTSRLKIYETVLRLHHGHSIKYQGGIGGLAVPTQRYRLRQNTAWQADYDIFGHHHQNHPGVRYFCNGSLIGYNAYAQDSGFEYEEPSQTYLLINKRFKRIIDYRPILFSV